MNNKRIIASVLGVVFLLSIACFAVAEAQSSYYTRIDCKSSGFSISVPKDWKLRKDIPQAAVFAVSPFENSTDTFLENLIVVPETFPRRVGLNEYADITIKNTQLNVSDFRIVKDSNIVIDGRASKRIVYTFKNKGIVHKSIMYLIVKNYQGYVITGGSQQGSFAKFEPMFDAMAKSFKFQ